MKIFLLSFVFFASCTSINLVKPIEPSSLVPGKDMSKLLVYRAGKGSWLYDFDYVVKNTNKKCKLKAWSYCVIDLKPGMYEIKNEDLGVKSFTQLESGKIKILGTIINLPNTYTNHFTVLSMEEWNEFFGNFEEYLPLK